MNRQTRYPLVFLVVIFLWLSGTCASMAQALTPNLGPALPAAAVLLSPTGVIVGSYSPTYSWNEVSEATWYYLWINGPSGNVFNQWYQAPDVCGGGTCSVAPPVTLTGGNHTWWIQTWNDVGYGPWSAGMDFSTLMQDTTYYVSPSGNDSNPGTQANPWKTIQKAADMVAAGSTVFVQSGNYAERVNIGRSGGMGAPITFQAQETVVMQGFTVQANYITIRGFEITDTPDDSRDGYGIWVQGSNCLIENNYIHYATRGGILLFASPGYESLTANCVIKNNRLYRNSQFGIDVRGMHHLIEANEVWGTIQHHPKMAVQPDWVDADGIHFFGSGHVLRKNYLHDIKYGIPENLDPHIDCFQTWDDGSYHQAASSIVIEQNLCINVEAQTPMEVGKGLMIQKASDLIIRNNIMLAYRVLQAIDSDRINIVNNIFTNTLNLPEVNSPVLLSFTNTPNSVIKNNIFYDPLLHSIYFADTISRQGVDIGYNSVYRSDGQAPLGAPHPNDLWNVNPLFVNASGGDFHLQANSPLVNKGASLSSVLTDYDGNTRPQGIGYDIGAYEFLEP